MATGLIYIATNKINGKIYIGQTKFSLEKRIKMHRSSASSKKENNRFLNAIRKYGIDGFKWEVLAENIPVKDLNWHESWFIATFDSKNKKIGYNSTYGGLEEKNLKVVCGRTPWNKGLTKEKDVRIKKSTEKAQQTRRKSKHISSPQNGNITYDAIYECIINKQMTIQEAAEHIGTTKRLVKKWKQAWKIYSINNGRIKKGQRLSPKTEFRRGIVPSNRKSVGQFTPGGVLIHSFSSIHEAASAIGGYTSGIGKCINGKTKTYKKFIWKEM